MADSRSLDKLFKPTVDSFMEAIRQAGNLHVVITSARRSYAEQSRLYRLAQEGKSGGLPAAYPGTSLHEWGLAVDLGVSPRSALAPLGAIWEQYGLGVWGGHFGDPVHFEALASIKKAAGWVKGAPYEAGLEPATNPIEMFLPSPGTGLVGVAASQVLSPIEDWFTNLFR
jgi:hypothetical protein